VHFGGDQTTRVRKSDRLECFYCEGRSNDLNELELIPAEEVVDSETQEPLPLGSLTAARAIAKIARAMLVGTPWCPKCENLFRADQELSLRKHKVVSS
jgi:hypothetical protein